MTKCKQDVKWLSNMAFTKMVGDDKIFTKTKNIVKVQNASKSIFRQ